MFAVVACQNEVVTDNKLTHGVESEVYAVSSDSSVVPLEQALKYLDEMITELYPPTRSVRKPSYSASNVETFVIPQATRSNTQVDLPDTLVYIVPFEESAGYAILGAQSSISPVYAITESGDFDNAKFAEAIEYDINNNILTEEECLEREANDSLADVHDNYNSNSDSIVYSLLASTIIDDVVMGDLIILDPTPVVPPPPTPTLIRTEKYTTMEIIENYPPLLTTEWHQHEPFNLSCKNNDGVVCPAGCTVIAVAQIIAYHEFPQNRFYCGLPVSWSLVKSYDYNTTYDPDSPIATQLSSLCCELGKSYLCDVVYTPSGSTSNATKAKRALENLGYRNVDKRLGLEQADIDAIINMVKNNKPTYVGAHTSDLNGHALVYDGYVKRRTKTYTTHYFSDGSVNTMISYGSTQDLFHLAWGYSNGMHNGYYIAKNEIDSNERYARIQDRTSSSDTNDPSMYRYYDCYFRVLTYDL